MSILDEIGYRDRDWTKNPYTRAEFIDLILARYQRSGIDPFFARKSGELPTEGDDFKTYFGDLVVGNIIEGIPGIQIKDDGTVHYEHKGPVDTTSWQTQASGISSMQGEQRYIIRSLLAELQPFGYLSTTYVPTGMIDYSVHALELTLAGGTGADALYAPGAGYKFNSFYLTLATDFTTQTQGYHIEISEETSGTIVHSIQCTAGNMWQNAIRIPFDSGTADKDLQIAVALGDGNEKIFCKTWVGKHT